MTVATSWFGKVVALQAAGEEAVAVSIELLGSRSVHQLAYPIGEAVPALHQRMQLTATQLDDEVPE